MLEAQVIEAVGEPRALVFLLHGRGADSTDLIPLANALALEHVRYVLPNGPQPAGSGRQWYAFGAAHGSDLQASSIQLKALIDSECRPLPGCRLALVGFSQGAVLALDAGFKYKPVPTAIVGLSGYLFEPPLDPSGTSPAVLLVHGSMDTVIPVSAGRQAYQKLLALGVNVQFEEFQMGHQINPQTLQVVRQFLKLTLLGA